MSASRHTSRPDTGHSDPCAASVEGTRRPADNAPGAGRQVLISTAYLLLASLGALFVFYVRADRRLSGRLAYTVRGSREPPRQETRTLYKGEVTVKAGSDFVYDVMVGEDVTNYYVSGYLRVLKGASADFEAVIADEANFQKWITGQRAELLYSSDSYKYFDTFQAPLLGRGRHVLALRRKRSDLGETRVWIEMQAHWDRIIFLDQLNSPEDQNGHTSLPYRAVNRPGNR